MRDWLHRLFRRRPYPTYERSSVTQRLSDHQARQHDEIKQLQERLQAEADLRRRLSQ